MAETVSDSKKPAAPAPAANPRGRLVRRLGIAAGVLVALLVIVYWVATSSAFVTGVILPQAGKAIGADISAARASVSPFSSVELRDVKVKTVGDEFLLETASLKARYRLWDILGGTITVSGVEIESPTVRLVQQPDGRSNLDPILEALATEEPHPKSEKPIVLNIGPVALKNAHVQFTRHQKDGSRMTAAVKGLDLSLDGVKNHRPLQADIGGGIDVALTGPNQNDALAATLKGAIQTELDDDLLPKQLKSDITIAVTSATGAFADAAHLNAAIVTDLTLKQIEQFAIRFTKAGAPIGQVTVGGSLDLMTQEGRLKLDITGIGNEVLSLVGAKYGVYFGGTRLAASCEIDLKNQAQTINTTGRVAGDTFSLRRGAQVTPTLDLRLDYNVALDLAKSNARIESFTFNATQTGRPLLSAALSKPMLIDWGKDAGALDESALKLTVNQLNLADWRPFLGTNVAAGSVSGKLDLLARQAGKDISLDLDAQLAGLAAQFGSNRIEKADARVTAKGRVTDLNRVALSDFTVRVAQAGQPVAALTGSGSLDSARLDADFQADVDVNLAALARLLNNPDLKVTSGTLRFTGKVAQKNPAPPGAAAAATPKPDQSVAGTIRLDQFTGELAKNQFDRFALAADVDVELKNRVAQINKASGRITQAGSPGGAFDASGRVDLQKLSGQVEFKLADLNQNALRSFAAAALAPNELKSVSINASAAAKFSPEAGSSVNGEFQVASLVIADPAGTLPQTPLAAKLNLDAGLTAGGIAELRKLTGSIQFGQEDGGSFDITGRYELASRKGQAALKVAGLNQHALRPFLAPALGETKLASVSINATANASYDPKGRTSVKADARVANLLLTNPKANLPKEPLSIGLTVDGGMAKQIIDLRQLQLRLTPTQRAQNELNVQGRLDFSNTNAAGGQLKVQAASLDVTPYYNLLAAPPAAKPPPAAKGKPVTPLTSPAQAKEPEPVKLPVQSFTTDINIGRFFLREIAVSNLVVAAKLDGSTVDVNPFKITFNGAPVAAEVNANLGVPGYQYDVRLNTDRLPIAPLVDTFMADLAGKVKGELILDARVKGAGVTGANIRRLLTGNVSMTLTNAAIVLPNPNESMKGGLGAVVLLGTRIVGFFAPVLKVSVSDLLRPPITWVDSRMELGNGQVDLKHLLAASEAFRVKAVGTVTLADVFTNSPINDIPVDVALGKPIALKAGLAKAETKTQDGYVPLPNFLKIGGTVGRPKEDIKELVITQLLLESGAAIPGKLGEKINEKTGGVLKGLKLFNELTHPKKKE